MASITREKNGRKIIQFVAPDGKRKSIRIGKVALRTAQAVKVKVEHLVAASTTGHALDSETARWVAALNDELADKLANVDLIPRREVATLGAFLDAYIAKRTDVKSGTILAYRQGRDSLIAFFGEDKPLRDITPGEGDEFLVYLREKYADATVGRRIKHAKQFLRAAARRRLVSESPFAELKGGSQDNPERMFYVSPDDTKKVIDACPDWEWRLLVGLARYGGFRVPSEAIRLRWCDVDWEQQRVTIRSPKTEHHKGKGSRQIPLFPELKPYLEEAWEVAEPGAVYVIHSVRSDKKNLRTRLERIIYQAGLIPWPRLWQNLRSSRETELAERFPIQVVCAWIGNSARVAAKHYLQVTDEHYQQALRGEGKSCDKEAVQNPVQQPSANGRKGSQKGSNQLPNCEQPQGLATPCETVQKYTVGPEGFEPPTQGL